MAAPGPVTAAPTAPAARIESLDILRGLALFGVLLENMQHFVSPTYWAYVETPAAGLEDRAVLWFIRFACDNKVYLIFSLLFGYGIALQIQRAQTSGTRFLRLHLWRMGGLYLIGLAHTVLLWDGDIVLTYAVLGLLLTPLRNAPAAQLRAVAVVFMGLPTVLLAGVGLWAELGGLAPAARDELEALLASYDYPARQSCFAFAMFALGLVLGRDGMLSDPARFVSEQRRWLPTALLLGVAANAIAVALAEAGDAPLAVRGVALELSVAIGTPALAFCFLYAACWLLTRPAASRRLRPLAAVGRTTLSNYLLQSAIGVGILRQTGLGPLGPITPVAGVLLTFAVFALQVALSRWWLARFDYGPVEWLWRLFTYGEVPRRRAT